ncbi:MAG: metallophosphoesterase [Chitinophagaceae bacterium]|nr:metallophosphoesterase [Chitinophagaceae bacterium]MCW5927336.1 metallophosphoesterase [Chitinophagaceae bacterium]
MSIDRRSFIGRTLAGVGAAGLTGLSFRSPENFEWQCVHNTNAMQTLISMSGIDQTVKILQIADTHISCDNESDKPYEQYSARMNKAFIQPKHYKTGLPSATTDNFKELMELAVAEKVDMIALVGDIVNYPSATAVEFVRSAILKTGIPYIYTAGNHDWHYEGLPGSSETLRKEWCEKRLRPLYTSDNIGYSSNIVNGINMVAIDNSTYQVSKEQVTFYKQQMNRPEPLALFVHIPLYLSSMRMCCGHPQWGAATDRGYETERREKWSAAGNLPSTMEFIQLVKATPRLAGVFAGHWHQYYSITEGNVKQLLALPGFNGQYRLIQFQSL